MINVTGLKRGNCHVFLDYQGNVKFVPYGLHPLYIYSVIVVSPLFGGGGMNELRILILVTVKPDLHSQTLANQTKFLNIINHNLLQKWSLIVLF